MTPDTFIVYFFLILFFICKSWLEKPQRAGWMGNNRIKKPGCVGELCVTKFCCFIIYRYIYFFLSLRKILSFVCSSSYLLFGRKESKHSFFRVCLWKKIKLIEIFCGMHSCCTHLCERLLFNSQPGWVMLSESEVQWSGIKICNGME